jgi:hypothetical protein
MKEKSRTETSWSVHTKDGTERDRAKQIFVDGGAEDISYTGQAKV